jgi:NAD+ diphosphatase
MSYVAEMRALVGQRPLILVGAGVLIEDAQERLLLQRRTDDGLWSIPGGGVEVGETVEAAARREVREETGLTLDGPLVPGGDQPWPVPHQLLVAFTGRAHDVGAAERAEELEDLRAFTRGELRAAVAAGDVVVPPPRALAGTLIGAWLAAG